MAALADETALGAWLGQDVQVGDARALAVLSAASNLVLAYTGQTWTADDVPDAVRDVVVQVAARVWLNPNPNVRNQTSGPFTEGYFDASAQGLYLTEADKDTLSRYAADSSVSHGLGTVSTAGGSYGSGTVYVPTAPAPSGHPFPWYSADEMWP